MRRNGNLLVTLINTPEVWEVDPKTKSAELVYHFPEAVSAMGVAEVEPDVFAVAIGNWSDVTSVAVTGSWSVWTIAFGRHHDATGPWSKSAFWTRRLDPNRGRHPAFIHKVTAIPEAGFLNGMTVLPTQEDTVLVGDADRGVVYSVNVATGSYHIALDEPEFKSAPDAPIVLGINGIHIHDGYLYFANTFASPTLARLPISKDGTAAGAVEPLIPSPDNSTLKFTADDFTVSAEGKVWLTAGDVLVTVDVATDVVQVVAGGQGDLVVSGDTSAAFGRTAQDSSTLYITTNGGIPLRLPQGYVGGKVLAVDTKQL